MPGNTDSISNVKNGTIDVKLVDICAIIDPYTGLPQSVTIPTFSTITSVYKSLSGSSESISALTVSKIISFTSHPDNVGYIYINFNRDAASSTTAGIILPDGFFTKTVFVSDPSSIRILGTASDKCYITIYN